MADTSATVRLAVAADAEEIWRILEPMIRAGETYALDRDMSRDAALAYWLGTDMTTFVAQDAEGTIIGTYFLRANQAGGGRHVSNCGYVVAPHTTGRGVARTMAEHSFVIARSQGFTAMQYNFVIASNVRAVRLWEDLGFAIVGRLPGAFIHPTDGAVDALVMHRFL
ncbi:N-acetyltransferase family protein [Novosphingobium sp.]|uniref:GNAT family N-acetyltransferase n=1 Tax=Novosphingobium sp. TaxID=1874826 RepID=UPI0038B75765